MIKALVLLMLLGSCGIDEDKEEKPEEKVSIDIGVEPDPSYPQKPCPTKPDPKPDPEPDPEPDPKPDPEPDPKPDPKPDPDPEPGTGDEWINAHNQTRSLKGIEPVIWSEEVAAVAQAWADTLVAKGCKMEHSQGSGYGENLAWASGGKMTPSKVVGMWTSEEKDYDYDSNTCSKVCGHYTQVVWKKTKRIGCAVGMCGKQSIWVCNYDPPGNYVGKRPY